MMSQPLDVVGEIVLVPVSKIDLGERLRPVDPIWASALGQIMAADGQNTPIEICRLPGKTRFLMVAGGHRLEGARAIGWTTIRAVVVDANAIDRRLREVSENIWRKGLDPIDRAAFVAELISLNRAKSGVADDAAPQSIAANARWSERLKGEADDASATMARAYGFADDLADQIGLSRRAIYRDLELFRGLPANIVAQLRGLPVASNAGQLRTLAKMPEADQRTAVAMILDGSAKSATEAAAMLSQKPVPSPEAKAWSAFFGGWSRMSAAKRGAALHELRERGVPKGWTVTFDGDAQ